MRRLLLALLGLAALPAALCGCGSSSAARGVTVMTQNLYYGTDLDPAIGAVLGGDPDEIVTAVTDAWANVVATDFPTRAVALANEIARTRPDLIGLQEAALWRSQTPSDAFTMDPTPATTVEYDFVEILRAALAARKLDYDVVEINAGFDVEFPRLDPALGLVDVRLTDRVALLARHDLLARNVFLSNAQHAPFVTNLPLFPGFEVVQGWASVDAAIDGHSFRFVTAHLDADSPDVASAQAAELLAGPLAAPEVIFGGDINSDANGGPGATPAYPLLLGGDAGGAFGDAWLLSGALGDGATWGHDALLVDPASVPDERIDVAVLRGPVEVSHAEVVGNDLADRVGGLWPSDHAGLVVTLRP